jgi:hypothetical protein
MHTAVHSWAERINAGQQAQVYSPAIVELIYVERMYCTRRSTLGHVWIRFCPAFDDPTKRLGFLPRLTTASQSNVLLDCVGRAAVICENKQTVPLAFLWLIYLSAATSRCWAISSFSCPSILGNEDEVKAWPQTPYRRFNAINPYASCSLDSPPKELCLNTDEGAPSIFFMQVAASIAHQTKVHRVYSYWF